MNRICGRAAAVDQVDETPGLLLHWLVAIRVVGDFSEYVADFSRVGLNNGHVDTEALAHGVSDLIVQIAHDEPTRCKRLDSDCTVRADSKLLKNDIRIR